MNEKGNEIFTVNSSSYYRLDLKEGYSNKLYHDYNRDINTVNTQYQVYSLPNLSFYEHSYKFPVYRVFLKNYGEKYISNEYGNIKLYDTNHTPWKNIKLIPDTSFYPTYNGHSEPLISDNIFKNSNQIHLMWTQEKRLSQTNTAYMLKITNENSGNIATLPNVRQFYISDLKQLPLKLITKIWDRDQYTETKVWRLGGEPTPIKETPSVFEVNIYPNPARDEMIVELPENTEGGNYNITVYNMVGQLVYSDKTLSTSYILKKEKIGRGMFWVKITDRKNSISKKIMFE